MDPFPESVLGHLIIFQINLDQNDMKISLNWLKDYIEIKETPEELAHILTMTGLEVEGIETVETIRGGLRGVVIGEVLECERHPNADKLSITKVDAGGESDD